MEQAILANADVAQAVEHSLGKTEVVGASPSISSSPRPKASGRPPKKNPREVHVSDDGALAWTFLADGRKVVTDGKYADLLREYPWFALNCRRGRATAYARTTRNKKTILLHDLILKPDPGLVCDHVNGDTLDNRRGNLRAVTVRANSANTRRKVSSVGYIGVQPSGNKFSASVLRGNQRTHLGLYESARDAAIAYDVAAKLLHGPTAMTNKRRGLLH